MVHWRSGSQRGTTAFDNPYPLLPSYSSLSDCINGNIAGWEIIWCYPSFALLTDRNPRGDPFPLLKSASSKMSTELNTNTPAALAPQLPGLGTHRWWASLSWDINTIMSKKERNSTLYGIWYLLLAGDNRRKKGIIDTSLWMQRMLRGAALAGPLAKVQIPSLFVASRRIFLEANNSIHHCRQKQKNVCMKTWCFTLRHKDEGSPVAPSPAARWGYLHSSTRSVNKVCPGAGSMSSSSQPNSIPTCSCYQLLHLQLSSSLDHHSELFKDTKPTWRYACSSNGLLQPGAGNEILFT